MIVVNISRYAMVDLIMLNVITIRYENRMKLYYLYIQLNETERLDSVKDDLIAQLLSKASTNCL